MKKTILFLAIAAMTACTGHKTGDATDAPDSTNVYPANVTEIDAANVLIDASHLQAVDLGLSVLWSTTNLGAKDDEDYGDFMTWQEAMDMRFSDGWRLPTVEEWKELDACQFEMEQRPSDVRVFVVYGKDGDSIVLTTNGYTDEDGEQDFGFYGNYWSSSRTADGLYPYVFRLSVPDNSHWTDKFNDDMHIGVRLVRPNPNSPQSPSENLDTDGNTET